MVVDWMAYSATYISVPTMILREKCEDLGLSPGDECNSSKEAQAQQAAFMAMFSLCTGAPSVAVCSLLSHLSDVIGRKPMFLLGNLQGVLMYGVLLINGARGASTLILITFINLLGGIYVTDGAIFASVADLTSNSSGHDRVRLMSIIEGAQWFGQILGPLIGGHVSTLVSPQTSFIVPTALYGVGLLLSVVAYPETLSHERRATFDFQKSHPFGVVSIARGYRRSMILASGLLFAQWGLGTGVATWPMFTKNSFDWKNDQIGNMEALYFTANAMGLFVLLPIINRHATPKAVITASAACSIFMWGCHILVTAGWMMFPLACLGMFSAMLFPLIRAGIATEFGPSMYGAALGVAALVQQTAKVGVLPAVGLAWHVIQESGLPDYIRRSKTAISSSLFLCTWRTSLSPSSTPRRSSFSCGCPSPPPMARAYSGGSRPVPPSTRCRLLPRRSTWLVWSRFLRWTRHAEGRRWRRREQTGRTRSLRRGSSASGAKRAISHQPRVQAMRLSAGERAVSRLSSKAMQWKAGQRNARPFEAKRRTTPQFSTTMC
ncbi:unnamed protein product, partial [Prorocentrum cordatum]